MRNLFKKIGVFTAAATLAVSAAALSACGYEFTPLTDNPASDAAVSSQGGFVVQKGDYVYFINGVETYTSDNTYGTPVKGALMRAKMADVKAGKNEAETVIPSLMVAADYTSGIYIYGDRIYYATPNNVGNTEGTVDNTYLDFKSVRLDGSDMRSYFRISDNAALYRFVQAGDQNTVYVVYEMDDTLTSYNTASGESVDLARDVTAYSFNGSDKTDPYVYYTMGVTRNADSDAPVEEKYNQLYRVRADATKAPYDYTWDEEWLEENNDGEVPYWNLGEIVLDGIAESDIASQFNHDVENAGTDSDNRSEWRYNYTLQSYTNGGVYFSRTRTPSAGSSVGTEGELYYLSADTIADEGRNSVTGNAGDALEMVASATDKADADSAAYFYIEDFTSTEGAGRHHYLFVNDAGEICRADVVNDGKGTRAAIGKDGGDTLRIAKASTDSVLVALDMTSDAAYDYVYYTSTTDNGLSVERAVFNGTWENYLNDCFLPETDADAYKAARILDAEHVSGWYNFEVVDGVVFYANAETFSSTAYSYLWTVNLNGADGLMDNSEIAAFNDLYDKMMGEEDGYLAKLTDDGDSKLSSALRYFFYTGETQQFYDNIDEAKENGKSATYLYSEDEQKAFKAFADGTSEDAKKALGEEYLKTSQRSYFTRLLGVMTEEDAEALDDYWQSSLERYVVTDTDDEGLPAWAWALIGVGIGLVVIGAGVAVFFVLRSRKKGGEKPDKHLMAVDTTDDRDVDVYTQAEGVREELTPAEAEEATEAPAEEAQKLGVPVEAESAEMAEAPAEEEPAAPAAADAAEAPAESENKDE